MCAQFVTQAVILAGGRGTRLGELTEDTPKPLLPVGGRPFLDYVIWNLVRRGIHDIVLASGYLGAAIRERMGDCAAMGAHVSYAEESSPLGTGGGVRFASARMRGPFFAINGDTVLDCDFQSLGRIVSQCDAKAGIMLCEVEDAGRFGAADFFHNRIRGFREKGRAGPGLVSGGVYLLTPEAVAMLPEGPCSLENDLLPRLAQEGKLAGVVCRGFFIDMGLPASYDAAQKLVPAWKKSVLAKTLVP